ncbi:hypothetical protein HAX54_018468 [Datura stramonium]|uniref:Peptidyl-tRNA hydrolase n=1 Tax=Datura stramonium TaxID=4076 RepID=A0ABS8UML2_DATST|nr:hypothetical protein [Datura stramonium]
MDLTLDVPLRVPLYSWTKLASTGVIDGVFCWWFNVELQIILYDSVNRRFWPLQLTEEMDAWEAGTLGVSGGALYYALCDEAEINVWCLESKMHSQDVVWVRKYAANISNVLRNCPGAFGPANSSIEARNTDIHPVNPHIFYLLVGDKEQHDDYDVYTNFFGHEATAAILCCEPLSSLSCCCEPTAAVVLPATLFFKINEMLRRICRRSFCTCSPRPWLLVGLGNPGDKYRGTRHNVGFEMLDAFANSQGIHMETVHCKAMFGKGFVNGIPVLLAKPLTYMNLSGESSASDHRIVNMECKSSSDIANW